jgi:hypothetical protein
MLRLILNKKLLFQVWYRYHSHGLLPLSPVLKTKHCFGSFLLPKRSVCVPVTIGKVSVFVCHIARVKTLSKICVLKWLSLNSCKSLVFVMVKGKTVPLQAWSGPEGPRKFRLPDFLTTAQDGGKVVSFTHRPHLPPRKFSCYLFLLEAESTPRP